MGGVMWNRPDDLVGKGLIPQTAVPNTGLWSGLQGVAKRGRKRKRKHGERRSRCQSPSSTPKEFPGMRRERIEAAVVAGGRGTRGLHEAWIAADPFKGGFRVLITGLRDSSGPWHFAMDDDPTVIAERVRETIEA
jgi:hypothetical protein